MQKKFGVNNETISFFTWGNRLQLNSKLKFQLLLKDINDGFKSELYTGLLWQEETMMDSTSPSVSLSGEVNIYEISQSLNYFLYTLVDIVAFLLKTHSSCFTTFFSIL